MDVESSVDSAERESSSDCSGGAREVCSSPKWSAADFQCSVCYELLLEPVVGSCGHDFCRHCIEEWRHSRQLVGQAVQCPICRAVLLPSSDQAFGVCIRLRETLEKLFPQQLAARRLQVSLAQPSDCAATCTATLPWHMTASGSGSQSTSTSSGTTTATVSTASPPVHSQGQGASSRPSSGGSPPPGQPPSASTLWLDVDMLANAADQYRELCRLVAAITAVPVPPTAAVHSFTEAVSLIADQAAAHGMPLAPQQVAELARIFLSSGAFTPPQQQQYQQLHHHAAAASASIGASSGLAAVSNAAGAGPSGNAFLQAALTLLTSAAATSSAAGQLRSLVSALQASGGAAALGLLMESGRGHALHATATNIQQLTSETAAVNQLLRMQYGMQLQQQQLQQQQQAAATLPQAHGGMQYMPLQSMQARQQQQYGQSASSVLHTYLLSAAAVQQQQAAAATAWPMAAAAQQQAALQQYSAATSAVAAAAGPHQPTQALPAGYVAAMPLGHMPSPAYVASVPSIANAWPALQYGMLQHPQLLVAGHPSFWTDPSLLGPRTPVSSLATAVPSTTASPAAPASIAALLPGGVMPAGVAALGRPASGYT